MIGNNENQMSRWAQGTDHFQTPQAPKQIQTKAAPLSTAYGAAGTRQEAQGVNGIQSFNNESLDTGKKYETAQETFARNNPNYQGRASNESYLGQDGTWQGQPGNNLKAGMNPTQATAATIPVVQGYNPTAGLDYQQDKRTSAQILYGPTGVPKMPAAQAPNKPLTIGSAAGTFIKDYAKGVGNAAINFANPTEAMARPIHDRISKWLNA